MYKMFEMGIHGGISTITHRHAEADSEYSRMYIDANNLYGWAMSQSLPTGNCSLTPGNYFPNANVLSVADDAPRGAILKINCEYLTDLHVAHNE